MRTMVAALVALKVRKGNGPYSNTVYRRNRQRFADGGIVQMDLPLRIHGRTRIVRGDYITSSQVMNCLKIRAPCRRGWCVGENEHGKLMRIPPFFDNLQESVPAPLPPFF